MNAKDELLSTFQRKQVSYSRFRVISVVIGLCLLCTAYQSAYAAVEFGAFDVLVVPTGVVLEWRTVSEYDLIGFEVWYKPEKASQSAYQLLGKRIAQGAPQRGVTYRMDVTAALKEDQVYCFQLRELPISGERGEILNRCGYGLGISAQPTPTPTPLFTPTSTLTTTNLLTATTPVTLTTPFTGPVVPSPTFVGPTTTFPTETLPSVPGTTDQGVPSVPPTETPTAVYQSVLPTPALDGQGQSPAATPWIPPPTSPLTVTQPVTMAMDSGVGVAANAPSDPFAQTASAVAPNSPAFESVLPTPAPPVAAVADPPYIVLTATATPEMVASAPTFTPYPTGLPQPEVNFVGLRIPDTQNLMIMLLCGVFSGASGLGILGLVSTLLYMRARAGIRPKRTNQR